MSRAPLAIVLGLVVVLAACSSEDRVAEAEEVLAAALGDRLGGDDAPRVAVTCPDDASLDAGSTLHCDVAVGEDAGQSVAFTIDDESGVELASAVIPTADLVAYLVAELTPPAEGPVEVDCGEDTVLVESVGGTVTCEVVRASDGSRFEVVVEVTAIDGTVTYEVQPSSTTTTTTAPPVTAPP